MCNHDQQEKGTFQRLEIHEHDSAQQLLKTERSNNLTVLNSHKERTAKFALSPPPPPPQSKWSPAPHTLKTTLRGM